MDQNFGRQIHCLARLMKKAMDQSQARSCMEHLTGTHGWIIGYLYHHRDREIFQKDLENDLGMSRSTVSTVLSLMEENGLLTRHSVPNDARLKKLALSGKAVSLFREFEADCHRVDEAALKGISPEEREQFERLCGIMIRNLEKEEQSGSGKEDHRP